MNNAPASKPESSPATREELLSALFAQMVIQQTNIAMMLMGKVPHPQTGETVQDLEGARMFIDQLEMLQVKTKGNLSPDEERLLKQSLLSAQMMFVDAVESAGAARPAAPATPSEPEPKRSAPAGESVGTEAPPSAGAPAAEAESEAESKKKFSKKY